MGWLETCSGVVVRGYPSVSAPRGAVCGVSRVRACAVSGPPRYFEIYNSSFQFSCHVKLNVARCHVSRTPHRIRYQLPHSRPERSPNSVFTKQQFLTVHEPSYESPTVEGLILKNREFLEINVNFIKNNARVLTQEVVGTRGCFEVVFHEKWHQT